MSTFKTTYSMADWKFNKMARREKSLQARPIVWLRKKIATQNPSLKKRAIIWLIMNKQYGDHSMEVYHNVKIERSAPKKP